MAFTMTSGATFAIALVISVTVLQSRAQEPGDNAAVGLPSGSTISGPLLRLPDGQIVVSPAAPNDAPAAMRKAVPDRAPAVKLEPTPSASTQRTQQSQSAATFTSNTHNATITRQIANAPGWVHSTSYPAVQAVGSAAVLAAGSSYTDLDIVTITGGTAYNALTAQLQLHVTAGVVDGFAYERSGAYTVLPTCPCSVTGGAGSGLTVSLTWVPVPLRVLAGPGYADSGGGGTFTNGTPVFLWVATVNGTSAATGNGPQSCPTPGTSTATDGGVTWKCLVQIDYNSISGYLFDAPAWATATGYLSNSYVTSNGNAYRLYNNAANANTTSGAPIACTSSTIAPSGTGTRWDGAGNTGCQWVFVTVLGYSSEAGLIPFDLFVNGWGTKSHMMEQDYYAGVIWYGGAARQEYQPGYNGETDPIMVIARDDVTHDDDHGENAPLCPPTWTVATGPCGGGGIFTVGNSNLKRTNYAVSLLANLNDSFITFYQNNPTAPLNYNSAHGVSIHALNPAGCGTVFGSCWLHAGMGIDEMAYGSSYYALQVKSDHGAPISGWINGGSIAFVNDILDGVGYCVHPSTCNDAAGDVNAVVPVNGGTALLNSLVIARGSNPVMTGLATHYPGLWVNDTVVNLGSSPTSVCFTSQGGDNVFFNGGQTALNNYCSGFTYQTAVGINAQGTLNGSISASATTLVTNSICCYLNTYIMVDNEEVQFVAPGSYPGNPNTNATCYGPGGVDPYTAGCITHTIVRGVNGTTPAAHTSGAIIAPGFDGAGVFSNNAFDVSPIPITLFYFGSNGATPFQFGAINMPGVNNTCGGGHASSCYGIRPAKQFVNPIDDFRLKFTADLTGAGAAANSAGINTLCCAWPNSLDIVDTARPQAGQYDVGAFQSRSGALPAPIR